MSGKPYRQELPDLHLSIERLTEAVPADGDYYLMREREVARLKNERALSPLRVRGIERVRLHADLTILAKLSCALARARVAPLAA